MITRLRFGSSVEEVDVAIGPDLGAASGAIRVVRCVTLPELSSPRVPHAAVAVEWFAGLADLGDPAGHDGLATVVAEQVVLRGADWLEGRWREGGARWKHMALAHRAEGLDQAGLSQRWRAHAGRAGGREIPAVARGQAYAQDHPVVEGSYDAVSEVWFDDLDDLRARVEWFGSAPPADELFRDSRFLAVREEVVWPPGLR